jgi:hypothetical protein
MSTLVDKSAPGTYAIPPGRGRWRLTLHARSFADTDWRSTIVGELADARGRRLEQQWNGGARLTFTINGRSPAVNLITELATDVIAWRWDDQTNKDVCMFRGIIAQAEDQLTEQSYTVTFTAHDYLTILQRRFLTSTYSVVATDQDAIVQALLSRALVVSSSSGQSFVPGSYLPIQIAYCNPDGTSRPANTSGQLRDRTYSGSTVIGQAIDDLAKVIKGFDYDLSPTGSVDALRIFYPYQGITRTDIAFVYGVTVSAVTRSVNSGDYGNYVRVLGNNGSSDPAAAQLYGEAWNADSNDVTRIAFGLWMNADSASDVSIQSTLTEKAKGDLALTGLVVPSYSLSLRPEAYGNGSPSMGDVVPLVIQAGRLNVNTTVRVLALSFGIGDDGDENVEATVGRPALTLTDLLVDTDRDVEALTRR